VCAASNLNDEKENNMKPNTALHQHGRQKTGVWTFMMILILALVLNSVCGMGLGLAAEDLQTFDDDKPSAADGLVGERTCTQTSRAAFKACRHESKDDYWIAIGNCLNTSDPDEEADCLVEAENDYREAIILCRGQKVARINLCRDLGQAQYDPDINPEDFVDFEAVLAGGFFEPNPYFPLEPGLVLEYEVFSAEDVLLEKIKVEVLDETKTILGINCLVVRDRVWEIDEDGEEVLIEDTHDWYAQDLWDNVWYFGEIVLNFEDGDLDNLDGSWKAGQDSAKAGYLMFAQPREGDIYRLEFYLGDAEDVAEVISLGKEAVQVPYGSFHDNILKTKDYTPLEPDVIEYKYYAPGIGMIKEIKPEDGEQAVLVNVIRP
jgi:hypothetical protein